MKDVYQISGPNYCPIYDFMQDPGALKGKIPQTYHELCTFQNMMKYECNSFKGL
jgi:hypothetical protein